MTIGASSHAIIVSRAAAATPTVFVEIAELSLVNLPGLMRNEFDASVQNRNIDSYVLGMLRRKAVPLGLNFLPADPTHDQLTGLYAAIINNTIDGYRFNTRSGASSLITSLDWIASGQVQAIDPKTPTDGKLEATVTLRLSGVMSINGVVIGS